MEKDVIKIEREQLEALVTVGLKVVVNWSLMQRVAYMTVCKN